MTAADRVVFEGAMEPMGWQTAAWEALSPGRRRGALYGIETAKGAATRARRIAAFLAALAAGAVPGRPTGRKQDR